MKRPVPTPDVIELAKVACEAACVSDHDLPIEAWSPHGPEGAPVICVKLSKHRHYQLIRKEYITYDVAGSYHNGRCGACGAFYVIPFDLYESAKVYFDGLVLSYGLEMRK